MIVPHDASRRLDADLARLDRDHLLVLELDDLTHLLVAPEVDPFTPHRGPARSGIDDLAATLAAATHLPSELTVRVLLPPGTAPMPDAQAALRRNAAYRASTAWREGMAVRNMGRRQLPIGLTISVLSAVVAYGAGYLATQVEPSLGRAALAVTAGLAITVAWVVSWMVIEASVLDWRPARRLTAAYDLLARSIVEVTEEASESR